MTQKEKIKLEEVLGDINSQSICEHSLDVGKMLSKEIAKYLRKNGYDVKSKYFKPVSENGYPTRIEFKINGFIVTKFSFLTTSACDKWLKNDKTFFKSLKECKEVALDDRYSSNGRSFKEFLKETKTYCMQQNLYEPDVDYNEMDER